MAIIKSYTDISQSKKLAEILPLESADMVYNEEPDETYPKGIVDTKYPMMIREGQKHYLEEYGIPCWSLAALLKYLSEIKPQVYTPVLFPSEGKWVLQFVEYSHGNVCEVSYDKPIDACIDMIEKLHELNLL